MTSTRSSRTPHGTLPSSLLFVSLVIAPGAAMAQDGAAGRSFVEEFDTLDRSFWYVSDGWSNGDHQNCTWSKKQLTLDNGMLQLEFAKAQAGDRDYACAELQSRPRYGYGTYEVRMRAASGSGLNSAFFSYIGPVDKQPHDELDFEVLGKDSSQVQVNQYVSGRGGNEKLVPVAGGADKDFHDYAFIWEKQRLRYFVDGKLVHEVTDATKIPSHPQKIFVSLWGSDNLVGWLGPFSYAGPVSMAVDRIAYTAPGEDCRFPQSVLCEIE
jgi:endo-1,3-1,4-beta-glycanase ExoK